MISVVLYGRNDSHGYNLHKRAAISLNCIAEMLSDENDEVLFVDYNTPNDLPTFVEAIYDTLTPKARGILRVFRVRPELHARVASRTHLFALEPHARNIAIRRSNPLNRWILFTNTDMIFIPRSGEWTLSTAVEDLPDGQYILPRFELPESFWELFPRSDPQEVMRSCTHVTRTLHLDEITAAHKYMRFDQPGDFQLVPRNALFDIHGFDERMIHGWHADSNMCKRLFLYYGNRTESLAHRLKGYHCDHTRVATGTHRPDVKLENDLYEFVYLVKDPVAHGQKDTWGAPTVDVEELDFIGGVQARYVPVLQKVLGGPQTQDYYSDSNDVRNYVSYTAEHVLPYVVGNLTVYPKEARFVYVGNHSRMLELLAAAVTEMGFLNPLHYVSGIELPGLKVDNATPVSYESRKELLRAFSDYDLVLFDLGLDSGSHEGSQIPRRRATDWPRAARYGIGRVARLIQDLAEHSQERWLSQKRTTEVLILNGNHHIFSSFIGRFLLAVNTPYSTRTRKGRPRVGSERVYRSASWKNIEDHMRAVFGFDHDQYPALPVEPGTVIDFTCFGHAAAYQDGHWGAIDGWGCWTDGSCAEIVFPVSPSVNEDLLVSLNLSGVFLGLNKESIGCVASFEGERLGRLLMASGLSPVRVRHVLPYRLMAGKSECRLRLEIENPQSVQDVIDATGQLQIGEDAQELGLRVQSVSFESIQSLKMVLGSIIDFTDKGTGEKYMTEVWTQPDGLGTWSLGPECHLVFVLDEKPQQGVLARFCVTDVAVNQEHPTLKVAVLVNGKEIAQWRMGPFRAVEEHSIFLHPDLIGPGPFKISFQIDSPRSPHELGWSDGDHRPLGFRLTRFQLDEYKLPRLKLGETIEFTEGGKGVEILRGRWAVPDEHGTWTIGQELEMQMQLQDPPIGPVPAAFVVGDCMVSESEPELSVFVEANGHRVANWIFGPERTPHIRKLEVPQSALSRSGELTLKFEITTPRTPHSFGWNDDMRPLGIRLRRALFGSYGIEMPSSSEPPAQASRGSRIRGVQSLFNRVVTRLRLASGGSA